jgi:glycosyltransferase involved in cell wall biosynthesis
MRLDLELICFIATQRPEWQVVLVGPEDDVFKTSKLHQLPNIHFLGAKPPILLPAYVHSFDVCINPQALNQMTMGNYPRKIDEYLAAGKPVVATLTEAMQVFAEVTFLCCEKEDYIPAIHTALSEKNDNLVKQRIKLAQSHTWQNSVELLYQAISEIKIN